MEERQEAIITGATQRHRGGVCPQLAAQGYNLVLVGRRAGRLNALAGELHEKHAIAAEVLICGSGAAGRHRSRRKAHR